MLIFSRSSSDPLICWILRLLPPLALLSIKVASSSQKHVVWIGDSVTRYTYIDYVYRLHHRGRSGAGGGRHRNRNEVVEAVEAQNHHEVEQTTDDKNHENDVSFVDEGSQVASATSSLESSENSDSVISEHEQTQTPAAVVNEERRESTTNKQQLPYHKRSKRGGGDEHEDELTPKAMLWERLHGNWSSYHKFSTAAFDGHMTCECYRAGYKVQTMAEIEAEAKKTGAWPPAWVNTVVENRHYRDPETGDTHTFFSYLGDHGGCRGASADIPNGFRFPANIREGYRDGFAYDGLDLEFMLKHVVKHLEFDEKPARRLLQEPSGASKKMGPQRGREHSDRVSSTEEGMIGKNNHNQKDHDLDHSCCGTEIVVDVNFKNSSSTTCSSSTSTPRPMLPEAERQKDKDHHDQRQRESSMTNNRVTHLILNFGWWPHFRDLDRLPQIFSAARSVVSGKADRVLWKGGTPAADGRPTPFVELERRVRSLAASGALTYVPFPRTWAEVGEKCFCDRVHFCCPEIYAEHNQLIEAHIYGKGLQ
ncbi:unnamed protein product [Amoebophrya sp. A25]|nr:unnamed protein product [Amoebophrya sp. A25]|eukprot:GSA25T00000143001.1